MTTRKNRAILIVMKAYLILAILLSVSSCRDAEAKKCDKAPIKIAVIDTGFGYNNAGHDANLCQYGHRDFSQDKQYTKEYATKVPIPTDIHSHGTNVVGIIESYLKQTNVNYCIVILKYYSTKATGQQNLLNTIRAVNYATNIKVDYINYSGGGESFSKIEKISVKRFLNFGGHIIAAAGNDSQELLPTDDADKITHTYYPAMYDNRIIVVGNMCKDGIRCKSSNYGSVVNRWEVGEEVTAYGVTMTGTSQATAVATGKIVAESDNKCDIGR